MSDGSFNYAVRLDLNGKRCVTAGGGRVAARKVRKLLEAGALVTVIAPEVCRELEDEVRENAGLRFIRRDYRAGDPEGAFLVIAATDSREANALVAQDAKRLGILVSVADDPGAGDFISSASYSTGPVEFTVSTGGTPMLAKLLKEDLEMTYGSDFGDLAVFLREKRAEMKALEPDAGARVRFWEETLDHGIIEDVKKGSSDKAKERISDAINRYRAESQDSTR
ncbi:MAG: bifunctional precorrin-2 dehydrogenase/sirohydrochlorin ferrochelatase [Anaerovoracaceae bacterium]